jgi:Raf kinase inhibitor-like YbhB/YbcL family protein
MKNIILSALIAVVAILAGIMFYFGLQKNAAGNPVSSSQTDPGLMKLSSPAFGHNGFLPAKYTCDGEKINPPLTISGTPEDAKSLALILHDPDAPSDDFVHWTVWNINPGTREISEKSSPGAEGDTSLGEPGYVPPCPPAGTHRYVFSLYALNTLPDLPPHADSAQLKKEMQGHILDQAELIGLYKRS